MLGFSQTVEGSTTTNVHHLLITLIFEHVCQVALAAVLTVEVLGHEDPSTTVCVWALTAHALHLVRGNLVILEHMELDLLLLVLDLLWLGVCLLLTLLATTTETQHKVKGAFLLDVVVLEST